MGSGSSKAVEVGNSNVAVYTNVHQEVQANKETITNLVRQKTKWETLEAERQRDWETDQFIIGIAVAIVLAVLVLFAAYRCYQQGRQAFRGLVTYNAGNSQV